MLGANPNIHLYIVGVVALHAIVEVWLNIRLSATEPYLLIRRKSRRVAWHVLFVAAALVLGMVALGTQLYMLALWMDF